TANYSAVQVNPVMGISGNVFNVFGLEVQRPDINGAGLTVTNAASLYVADAPGGSATKTNNYAIWVDDGNVRLDRQLGVGGVATPQANLHVQGKSMFLDNTTGITANYFATQFNHSLAVAANVFNVFGVQVDRPNIDGSGFTITNAASLYVAHAPGGSA